MKHFISVLTVSVLVAVSSDAGAQVLQPKVNLKGVCESRADQGSTAYKLVKLEKNVERNSLSMGVDFLRCVKDGAKYRWESIPADAKRAEKTPDGRNITLWQSDVELLAVDEDSKVIGQMPLTLDSKGRIELTLSKKLASVPRAELMIRGHQYYEVEGQAPVSDGVSTTASYMLKLNSEGTGNVAGVCQPRNGVMDSAGLKTLPPGMVPAGVQPGGAKTGAQASIEDSCNIIFGANGFKPGTMSGSGSKRKPAPQVNKALGK